MNRLQNSLGERFFPETGNFFENGGHETTLCILNCNPHKIQRRLSHALNEHDSRYLEPIARGIISQLNARSRSADAEPPAFCHGSGSEAGRDFYSDAFVRSWSATGGPRRRKPGMRFGWIAPQRGARPESLCWVRCPSRRNTGKMARTCVPDAKTRAQTP